MSYKLTLQSDDGTTFGFFFKVRRTDKPDQESLDSLETEFRDHDLLTDIGPNERTIPSLVNPPVEVVHETHPAEHKSERYAETKKISEEVEKESEKKNRDDAEQAKDSGINEEAHAIESHNRPALISQSKSSVEYVR